MARPTKSEHEQRKNRTVRFTDSEWAGLTEKGRTAGLKPSEFVRDTALGASVTLAYGPKPADPDLVCHLNRVSIQLSNYGNLINQMAPYAHVNEEIPADFAEHWMELKADVEALKKQCEETLEAVVGAHVR